MRIAASLAALMLATTLLVGCIGDEESDLGGSNPYLFTWTAPEGPGDAAAGLLLGRMDVRNGCIYWLSDNGSEFLPLWPDGALLSTEEGTVVVSVDGTAVAEGQDSSLSGGERTRDQAEALLGESLPSVCNPADGYWVATGIESDAS